MAFVEPPGEWGMCTSSGAMGCSIIFEKQIGIRGDLEVKLLTSEE